MGLGDEIMVTGEAKRLQEADADRRPVAVFGQDGRRRWSSLWHGNPRILPPTNAVGPKADGRCDDYIKLVNGPRCRPYVDYAAMAQAFKAVFPDRPFTTKVRDHRLPWRYTDWRASAGELYCVERLSPRGYIVVEPNPKAKGSPNKDWGWAHWQALVHAAKWTRHPYVQLGPAGTRRLDGVGFIETPTFLDAARALSGAAALVATDGGLHHAAAALAVPAVVIFGGMTSPANLGYDEHVNLFEPMGGASPCGQWVPCRHCREAMGRITVERVAEALSRFIEDGEISGVRRSA